MGEATAIGNIADLHQKKKKIMVIIIMQYTFQVQPQCWKVIKNSH